MRTHFSTPELSANTLYRTIGELLSYAQRFAYDCYHWITQFVPKYLARPTG